MQHTNDGRRSFAPATTRLGTALAALALACAIGLPGRAHARETDGVKLWATATATRPGDRHVMIYRFIKEFEPGFDRSPYADRVEIAWCYDSSSGMPGEREQTAMVEFEDTLDARVTDRLPTMLALVSTGEGCRRWTFYAKSGADIVTALDATFPDRAAVPIRIEVHPDPHWTAYAAFLHDLRP